jgi:hypothetical protein
MMLRYFRFSEVKKKKFLFLVLSMCTDLKKSFYFQAVFVKKLFSSIVFAKTYKLSYEIIFMTIASSLIKDMN